MRTRPHVGRLVGTAAATFAFVVVPQAPVATAAVPSAGTADQCTFPGKTYEGRPWALQRVLLDEVWKQSMGEGVRVAVIDTGVDVKNRQLAPAVDVRKGRNFLSPNLTDDNGNKIERGRDDGTTDVVGHGTKVAGIIAARPAKGTGFVGLAPKATIIPIQQNDAEGHGDTESLAAAINYATREADADIINISQDTVNPIDSTSELKTAVDNALARDIVIVASAGNDGLGGNVKETYPASYEGVLAVAAADRNNERAVFSQSGEFVDVAAPGVDMVSTVPGGGHCADNGTSFSAPYVAGVAALIKAKHPRWTQEQITAQIMQTAERSIPGHDRLVGWGVVDPVRALTEDDKPIEHPVPSNQGAGQAPAVAQLPLGETPQERAVRLGTYVVVGSLVLVAVIGGGAVAGRDARRRTASGKASGNAPGKASGNASA
ncbi:MULTISPECIES: type VII secretion-associated serine protease mycosin [unclassified Streptomyces]|uniref:type VII secretion-associated serine protease mycosin n=1 Tax=unclassified Streptomyces TaxID=2593676 RepID=UPI0023663CC8|nr:MULTISPECIES: type VII secretion-associated serine protease mycosin [unclassified Streptomyces]MDF3141143.1 type VII secretion-associated serine protease mycosin [Streptomyces sp. T21Q-yed]WDF40927.1 type VII secretion-associated serine protease mycosin [Streptomyces sp. T12]